MRTQRIWAPRGVPVRSTLSSPGEVRAAETARAEDGTVDQSLVRTEWLPGRERERPVLLVEDDPDIRRVLSLLIQEEGYPVATVANGEEALRYLRSMPPPRLILLDLMMPGMNGWRFVEEQRQHPDLARIPLVILSGVAEGARKATDLDANDYLVKPVRLSTLRQVLSLHCQPSLEAPSAPIPLLLRIEGGASDHAAIQPSSQALKAYQAAYGGDHEQSGDP